MTSLKIKPVELADVAKNRKVYGELPKTDVPMTIPRKKVDWNVTFSKTFNLLPTLIKQLMRKQINTNNFFLGTDSL